MDQSFHLLLHGAALRPALSLAQVTAFRRTAAWVPDPAPHANLQRSARHHKTVFMDSEPPEKY